MTRRDELYPITYELTRNQIRKVDEMGGVQWLRDLISKTQKSRHGRDPVQHAAAMKARDHDIVTSAKHAKQLAFEYNLSPSRVNAIRRQYGN